MTTITECKRVAVDLNSLADQSKGADFAEAKRNLRGQPTQPNGKRRSDNAPTDNTSAM
jgi:hypothetical protein